MTSEELELILPEGATDGVTMLPARPFVTVRRATSLARRHVKNNRPLNRWPAPDTAAMQNGKTSMDGMRPC
ncbi:hypothetical protein [Paracoccus aerodenitrificans]|uniref:hypothetical protein n=1 Tax=Paracoccus aerodenitrificans TaxID=3017781 RepID=UPI0022F08F21|nr:hypothetical protein [Paracoccus aerodenitrificans]WBU65143.1 hypothetical protein PAE61_06870 [Paracoccus aerodenitrificans]